MVEQFPTIRPNITKIIVSDIIEIFMIILLIAFLFAILHFSIGLDVFLDVFEAFGINIDLSTALLYSIILIFLVSAFIIIANLLIAKNLRVEFFQDKMIVNQSKLFLIDSLEIPYQNIVKVLFKKESLSKILNSGTVILELTGMSEPEIKIKNMDDTEQIVQYIHNLIQKNQAVQQEQFAEDYRVEKILDRF